MSEENEIRAIKKAIYDLIEHKIDISFETALIIKLDFSHLPKEFLIANPRPPTNFKEETMITISVDNILRNVIPGLWGYANNAGIVEKNIYKCPECGKTCNCCLENI